jgi:2-polyprenyl-3-methyl-5-hydroxy-6-metoxy-1,4-benzoquinol methylase
MNISMYRLFFKIQKKHWWFVTKKEIILDTICNHVDKSNNIKILDVGCGSGLMLNSLEKIGHTFGIDMSDEAVYFSKEIFRGQVKRCFLPNQIPYKNISFNLIIALDVIEHIDRDVDTLISLRSRMANRGIAIITVPAYMFLWSAFDEINELNRRYTKKELEVKLNQAGFVVEKISYFNTFLFPIIYIVRMLNKITKRDGASDIEMPKAPINSLLKIIFRLEKYLLRYVNLPFGVSILAVVKKSHLNKKLSLKGNYE